MAAWSLVALEPDMVAACRVAQGKEGVQQLQD